MKKISVVIPAYNAAAFISEALDSVLTQEYPNFEVLVVDYGPQDDTRAVVEEYSQKGPVRYIHQLNAGPGAREIVAFRRPVEIISAFLTLMMNCCKAAWRSGRLSSIRIWFWAWYLPSILNSIPQIRGVCIFRRTGFWRSLSAPSSPTLVSVTSWARNIFPVLLSTTLSS